jgi:hypothetical protein
VALRPLEVLGSIYLCALANDDYRPVEDCHGAEGQVQQKSNYRIQRFLAEYEVDFTAAEHLDDTRAAAASHFLNACAFFGVRLRFYRMIRLSTPSTLFLQVQANSKSLRGHRDGQVEKPL